jgi:N-methylhydantoinase A
MDGAWVDTPHYDRAGMNPGNRLSGPAIVTQLDSTVLVLPGHEAEVDRFGNILIWPEGHRPDRDGR